MATEIRNLKLSELEYNEGQFYGLPKNPRWIRDARFEALKKSIEDAPEMLELRELLIYPLSDLEGHEDKFIVIGGNMRLRACRELGYTEVPCKVLPLETPVKKLREYAIKDNEAFGQNDFDVLANEWDMEELQDFGMELDYLTQGSVDFSSVDDLEEEAYEPPKIKMLQCPSCHHIDMAIHFKSVEGDSEMKAETNEVEDEDIS